MCIRDSNIVERMNWYIFLSRKNSLFFGSHKGAERGAILYTIALTCLLYTSFETDHFYDTKVKRLKNKFGMEDWGVFHFIVNEIYRVEGCYNCNLRCV